MNKEPRTKNQPRTGIRNGNLFCFNCGGSHILIMPIIATDYIQITEAFNKLHKNCKPVWKQPVNTEAAYQTELTNELWWIKYGEHGMSSETMFAHLTTELRDFRHMFTSLKTHPSDPDDFSRCYKLLKNVPHFQHQLSRMRTVSPIWDKLIDHWAELTIMYEAKDKNMYDLMKSLGC